MLYISDMIRSNRSINIKFNCELFNTCVIFHKKTLPYWFSDVKFIILYLENIKTFKNKYKNNNLFLFNFTNNKKLNII